MSHSENAPRKFQAHPQSAPGDFYVVNNECIACGAPHAVAPDLIGWATLEPGEHSHCIWKKQPETPAEWEQTFLAFDASEVGCYRYAGTDPNVIKRLGHEYCDQAVVSESHTGKHTSKVGWIEIIAPGEVQFTLTASRLTRIGSVIRSILARLLS